MKLNEIRQRFFDFFEGKNHEIVASAPMVIKNDPTLMFTNAGMNQFKDYFLGNSVPTQRRIANSQKCLRVSGKHNDLEEVGVDTYHHTMFEMLGNWSFGDYFKKEAITWAWELLTEVYQIPKDRLYVTVFEGDEKDGVPQDQESFDLWKQLLPEERIIFASKKDNFWEMGDVGPCGPCSEIHIDIRSEEERQEVDGKSLVNQDHPQVIEIWNNVFMQFNRKADGSLESLPEKHVDTGMGLERLAMALQGKTSNYDIDLFQDLIQVIEKQSGKKYGQNEVDDIAMRVIADHVRAIAFSIADGQLPSNNGAGYVIRRILRRAVRYGYQTLDLKEPFLADLSLKLIEIMGEAYPELKQQKEIIEKVIREEELAFFRTLEQGLKRMDNLIAETLKKGEKKLPGVQVFELYDTYGFPLDLTSLIARENEMEVDEEGFNQELQKQKDRSRAAGNMEIEDWIILEEGPAPEFVGYDSLETEAQIRRYRKVEQKKKVFFQLVLDKTPFYPEGGGQIGDTGVLEGPQGKIQIIDTRKENNLLIHLCSEIPKNLEGVWNARVNESKRRKTASNHSATHLLHAALRKVLGTHVEQKGSYVGPDYLRFDFSHFAKLTPEELQEVEREMKQQIRANWPLEEFRKLSMEEAQEKGAMMLFGEKYGDEVRMIQFGASKELCGGTHVKSTGEIGLIKITGESAVAAGIRRIELITGEGAEQYFIKRDEELESLGELLKHPKNIQQSVEDLLKKNAEFQKKIEQFEKEKALAVKSELKSQIRELNGFQILAAKVPLEAGAIKDILFQLKGEHNSLAAILGGEADGKCSLSIMFSDQLVKEKQWNAGQMVRELAKHIQGGGGGQDFFATAGGKNPAGLDQAISEFQAMIG